MIKNTFLYLLLVATLLIGCDRQEVIEKPENLIPKDKMEDIIYDLTILSASKGYSARVLEENGIEGEQLLYTKYNIDSAQFAQSNVYYASKPEEFSKLFDNVQKRLEVYKTKLDIARQAKNEKAKGERSSADSVKTIDPKTLKKDAGNKVKDQP